MKHQTTRCWAALLATILAMQLCLTATAAEAKQALAPQANCVAEVALEHFLIKWACSRRGEKSGRSERG